MQPAVVFLLLWAAVTLYFTFRCSPTLTPYSDLAEMKRPGPPGASSGPSKGRKSKGGGPQPSATDDQMPAGGAAMVEASPSSCSSPAVTPAKPTRPRGGAGSGKGAKA
eukprot:5697343-Pyramimonas_sp.AAC.1